MTPDRSRVLALPFGAFVLAFVIAALIPAAAGAAPPEGQLTFVPNPVSFGPTTAGTNSGETQVEIRNQSAVTIEVNNVSVQGAESSEFSLGPNPCNGAVLGAGEICIVGVTFTPHSVGSKATALRITSSDEAGEENVPLSGLAVAPDLAFEPVEYDFGLRAVNSEGDADTQFQVRNVGQAAVHVDNVDFEGPGREAFNIGNTDCFGANLAPAGTCSLQIRFHPRQEIPYALDVRVSANGYNFTAELKGQGGDPHIVAGPAALGFGTAPLGSAGAVQTLTLTNEGNLPANYFIAFLTGGDVDDFRLLSENCTKAPLAAGASCSAQVRFQPTSAGAKSSKLTFISGGESPLQIDLGGTGVAPALSLGPAALTFGKQATASSSGAQVVTLTNRGGAPIEVDAAAILGPAADQFKLSDSCSGASLPPGAGCSLAVRFAPDDVGPQTATLRVLAGGQRLTAALSGTAVAPGRVLLNLSPKPLVPKGDELTAGTFACEAQSTCTLNVRATIATRTRVNGRSRGQKISLKPSRLSVPAGGTRVLKLHLSSTARAALAEAVGTPHLQLAYDWSAEGQTGSGGVRRAVR